MSFTTSQSESHSDGRLNDIARKHRLVAEFLQEHRYDAVLLQKPENFSWLTSGSRCTRGGSETTGALFITPDARVLVTNNVDSVQFFEHDLAGLGFQLKQRAWHESHSTLLDDLCRGRTVASDTGLHGTSNVSVHLKGMRLSLSSLECYRARRLGRRLAHAVEATARQCQRGQSEAEIAGEIAHRLMRHRAEPVRIQVAGDGRNERFRHWRFGNNPVEKFGTISAIAQREGLCVGVSRTFSFGEPPASLQSTHNRAMLLQATGMYFSQADWELSEVWKRVKRIYEKFDYPDEWQNARQAEILGYQTTEIPLLPKSEFRLSSGMMIYWHPSIEAALGGDSILIHEKGFELLTPTENWPTVAINVKGKVIKCPAILKKSDAAENSFVHDVKHSESQPLALNPFPDDAESETDLSALVVE